MLIAIANQKGGTAKSTIASLLLLWLHDAGINVALLDTDEQQTSSNWVSRAEPAIPIIVAHDIDGIRQARAKLSETHSIIVADTPGSSSDAGHTAVLLADCVVVPLQASRVDVLAIKDSLKYIRLAREMSGGQRPDAKIVLTFTAKGDVQTRRLRDQLAGFDVPIAVNEIRRLNAFRDAFGTSVTRSMTREAREAARDVENVFQELFGDLVHSLIPQRVMHG
jgi:chromosome partitioning protein